MTLYTWYMVKANFCAWMAETLRNQVGAKYLGKMIRELQDLCATYVTLANQALARYGA